MPTNKTSKNTAVVKAEGLCGAISTHLAKKIIIHATTRHPIVQNLYFFNAHKCSPTSSKICWQVFDSLFFSAGRFFGLVRLSDTLDSDFLEKIFDLTVLWRTMTPIPHHIRKGNNNFISEGGSDDSIGD